MKPVHRPDSYRGFFIEEQNNEGGWDVFSPTPYGTRRAANDAWRKELRLLAKGWKFRVKLHRYEHITSEMMRLDGRTVLPSQKRLVD